MPHPADTPRAPAPSERPRNSPPAAGTAPEVAYSESRARRLARCPRAYYHAVYSAQGGWSAPPHSEAWVAYRCKRAVPLFAAVGDVVHHAVVTCVRAVRAGGALPAYADLRAEAGARLNGLWQRSRHRRRHFLHRPSSGDAILLGALYGDGQSAEDRRRARARLERAHAALPALEWLWASVAAAGPDGAILMDPFHHFALPDPLAPRGATRCYAAADLVLRAGADAPSAVIDVKTGGADGVIDQIMTYALAVRDGLGLDVAAGCRGAVVALGEGPAAAASPCWFAITPADLAAAAARVRTTAARMWALHAVAAGGSTAAAGGARGAPARFSCAAFPQTRDARVCRSCEFRALCYPARHPLQTA